MEYDELLEFVKYQVYVPNLNVFSGGGEKYHMNVVKNMGIIIYSIIGEKVTYISEVNGKIRESSGYMLFTILKNHLNRYIFSDGLIPVHAALLCFDGGESPEGVVILGETGTGKSTLCYGIHKELGYGICADDLIVFNPDKREIYGYCEQFFLKEDVIHKYGLEEICKKRNGKYGISVENSDLKRINKFKVICLKKDIGMQMLTPKDMDDYIMDDTKCWFKTGKEEVFYKDISRLFKSAQCIISGSYLCTNLILGALRNEEQTQ